MIVDLTRRECRVLARALLLGIEVQARLLGAPTRRHVKLRARLRNLGDQEECTACHDTGEVEANPGTPDPQCAVPVPCVACDAADFLRGIEPDPADRQVF